MRVLSVKERSGPPRSLVTSYHLMQLKDNEQEYLMFTDRDLNYFQNICTLPAQKKSGLPHSLMTYISCCPLTPKKEYIWFRVVFSGYLGTSCWGGGSGSSIWLISTHHVIPNDKINLSMYALGGNIKGF